MLLVRLTRVGVGVDRHERRPILVGTGILDAVCTLALQDFRQLPAAVEAGDALEVCEQEVGLCERKRHRVELDPPKNEPAQSTIPDQKRDVFQRISAFVEKFKGVGGKI